MSKQKKPAKRKIEAPSGLTIYSTQHAKDIPLERAMLEMTEENLDAGNYCAQTLIDALDCCRGLLARVNQREKLFRLCTELDMEMDGVGCPASAAAILNAIRGIVDGAE